MTNLTAPARCATSFTMGAMHATEDTHCGGAPLNPYQILADMDLEVACHDSYVAGYLSVAGDLELL